ncbi:MAG: efflux RND transporter periplasmic adaptor subunit [Bacteroidaceae bacterium]|nr:efflux RND transporter periplasmic adaptor subunit [Bacteroidaceae bacterium]
MRERILMATLLMVMLLTSCRQPEEKRTKTPTKVKTEVMKKTATTDGKTYVGVVEENVATAVSFTSMGIVSRIYVSEGQAVSAGQLLAEMDDTQARNLLEGAKAQVAQAEDALERYRLLNEQGSLPEVQWVEIQSKVAQARSQLAIAQKNMADCRLTAPVGGIIGRKALSAGETAMPSQAVVTILDISSVKVRFAVPETEVAAIRLNSEAKIHVEAIGADLTARNIERGVQADALTHTYDMRARINNNGSNRLMPGMVAMVSVNLDNNDSETAFTVPLTAVQRRADGSLFLWTMAKDSSAHRTPVSVGATYGNRICVTSGLSDGQRVVVEGYQKLSEDTKIIEK